MFIDFVITWVDSADIKWINKYNHFYSDTFSEMNGEKNFRNWDILKYWFRAVEENAPWVHKIFFVTEGHLPQWLDTNNEKLVVIKHEDFIDKKYLPTFNSNVIELNLHKIPTLSQHFVSFNDDMFVNGLVEPKDFFDGNLPRDTGVFSPIVPTPGGIVNIVLNDVTLINKHFDLRSVLKKNWRKYFKLFYGRELMKNILVLPWKPILGFYDNHTPISYNKDIYTEVYDREKKMFEKTFSHRFRTPEDISHWLVRYWQLCSGNFSPRKASFGKYYSLGSESESLIQDLKYQKHKLICLNDSEVKSEEYVPIHQEIGKAFEERYGKKSSFEK
ncbi:stealth family protein [Lactovum odontotermitis]